MKRKDLADLLSKAAACIEDPNSLIRSHREELVEDLLAAETEFRTEQSEAAPDAPKTCIFCEQNGVEALATHRAPQGNPGGPFEFVLVCADHVDGWWDGSDFPDGQGAPPIELIEAEPPTADEVSDWTYAVINGDTKRGLIEWVANRREDAEQDDA